MKDCSPLAIYVHCYAHRLNLALQDTMKDIALGTIQAIYNFLEASTKRHFVLKSLQINDDLLALSMKSLSTTRWSCHWEAVRAIREQIPRIIQALIVFSNDNHPRTYTESRALLNAICDFQFVFGLVFLKVILSNTNGLSKYLQGKTIDVSVARRNSELTINFKLLWMTAEKLLEEIADSSFVFKNASVSRRLPSKRW